jgi:glutamine synthetase
MTPSEPLQDLLALPYRELEKLNLEARDVRDPSDAESKHTKYLDNEKRVTTLTVCFCDIEGRFHLLDYDKDFLLDGLTNLTFDGSSIRGFSEQSESDLRLVVDWTSFTHVPSDIFGPGKVLVFANVADKDGNPYEADFRGRLQAYAADLKEDQGLEAFMATEQEGFVIEGIDAEQKYQQEGDFKLVAGGGYFHALPMDRLRTFIDTTTQVLRAMGFRNEKNHPEVAPSSFEIDYAYTDVVRACDQILLYKLICRQVARNLGMTATFLPKPLPFMNGTGMHTNFSLSRNGVNAFYDKEGKDNLSDLAWSFIDRVLHRGPEMCLVLSSSVNAYRRLDPHFEAPNETKAGANDRGAMIRIPLGNERTTRIEVRSVAPDSNPYLLLFTLMKAGLEDQEPPRGDNDRPEVRLLPSTIEHAMNLFNDSGFMTETMGENPKAKYLSFKRDSADRAPRILGTTIKQSEIIYHHEIYSQDIWNRF